MPVPGKQRREEDVTELFREELPYLKHTRDSPPIEERATESKGGENGSGRLIMDTDFIESLLVWNERGPSEGVRRWFIDRGFDVTPMRAGLLISGPRAAFETALSVDLEDVDPPVDLPIPREVREHVASFGIPRPRRIY
jgi:hypothetical protein